MVTDSSELTVAVEKPETWARRLRITVPAGRVARHRQEVAARLASRVKLPGFRKGKVPARVLEQQYGAAIDHELLDRVVGDAYREALRSEGLQPITQGEVANLDYAPGQDLTFDVQFEIRPEIELNRLGGFRVARQVPVVAEEEVDRVIERLQEQHATWSAVTDESPLTGDMVTVEIVARGEEEGEAKPRRYELALGKGEAIEDVEDAIRTLRPGDEGEFTLRVPDPEAGEGATRDQQASIRLLELRRPEMPALDDDFARTVGDFGSLEVLRSRIRADLEREARMESERELRRALMDQILEANPVEVPSSMVRQYMDQLFPPREGADPAEAERMRELAAPGAERAIRRMLVVARIAELESLHASAGEIDERVQALAERAGRPAGEIRAQLQKSGRLEAIAEEITEEKVFEYLKAQSTIE